MSKLFDILSTMIEKINSSVKTSSQDLTEEEKSQARKNIGIDNVSTAIQSDWNQNDATALDYVKNRTHYREEIKREIFVAGFKVYYPDTVDGQYTVKSENVPELDGWYNKKYHFKVDGQSYEVISESDDEGDSWVVNFEIAGQVKIIWRSSYDDGEVSGPASLELFLDASHYGYNEDLEDYLTLNFEIYEIVPEYHYTKLSSEYLQNEIVNLNKIPAPVLSSDIFLSATSDPWGSPTQVLSFKKISYDQLADRPFYDNYTQRELVVSGKTEEQNISGNSYTYVYFNTRRPDLEFSSNKTYIVEYNEEVYENIPCGTTDDASRLGISVYLGNPALEDNSLEDNGLPFLIYYDTEDGGLGEGNCSIWIYCKGEVGSTLSLYQCSQVERKTLDPKFLPESVVFTEDIEDMLVTSEELDTLTEMLQ